jgi:hypothetical protein
VQYDHSSVFKGNEISDASRSPASEISYVQLSSTEPDPDPSAEKGVSLLKKGKVHDGVQVPLT